MRNTCFQLLTLLLCFYVLLARVPNPNHRLKRILTGQGKNSAVHRSRRNLWQQPGVNGEEYCQSADMLTNENACKESSCCVWNTWEQGEASNFGKGRCWSRIFKQICTDMPTKHNICVTSGGPNQWCVPGAPHYDQVGQVCDNGGEANEKYCYYENNGDFMCGTAKCVENASKYTNKFCVTSGQPNTWCVPGAPHYDQVGQVCDNGGEANEKYCYYDRNWNFMCGTAKCVEDANKCRNTDHGATDIYGDSCESWYDDHPNDCGFSRFNDHDFNMDKMCCACGGGQRS